MTCEQQYHSTKITALVGVITVSNAVTSATRGDRETKFSGAGYPIWDTNVMDMIDIVSIDHDYLHQHIDSLVTRACYHTLCSVGVTVVVMIPGRSIGVAR